MEVRQIIDSLHFSIEHTISEDELVEAIAERLTTLRRSYSSHRFGFTDSDIDFLRSLNGMLAQLQTFNELKEELLHLNSVQEYMDMVSRLASVKDALACFPVAKRVAKEIRELNERLPAIREQTEAHRLFRQETRIYGLEQRPRRCPRNHPMVLREGRHGHFWGCSEYPFCNATAQLTREQGDLLNL